MTESIECNPNDLIAVDTDVLVDYDQLDKFLTNFGFKNAKFIANIPKNWIEKVSQNVIQQVKARTNENTYEINSIIDALNRMFDSTYAKCELFYELTHDESKILDAIEYIERKHIEIAYDKRIVRAVITKEQSDGHFRFDDIRLKKIKFSETEQVRIREISSSLNEPDSVVNQQVRLFERIIDYNDEISLMDRYLNIKLAKDSKVDLSTDYNKFLDKLFKKIAFYAEIRKTQKTLNIYLDQESGRHSKNPIYHSSNDLNAIKMDWLKNYKSLFVKGMIIKLHPYIPISQDTHDRWFIGHTAGGWGCLRGAKDTITDELNFYTLTADTRLKTLCDYGIKKVSPRIKLDFNLVEPIVISINK